MVGIAVRRQETLQLGDFSIDKPDFTADFPFQNFKCCRLESVKSLSF